MHLGRAGAPYAFFSSCVHSAPLIRFTAKGAAHGISTALHPYACADHIAFKLWFVSARILYPFSSA